MAWKSESHHPLAAGESIAGTIPRGIDCRRLDRAPCLSRRELHNRLGRRSPHSFRPSPFMGKSQECSRRFRRSRGNCERLKIPEGESQGFLHAEVVKAQTRRLSFITRGRQDIALVSIGVHLSREHATSYSHGMQQVHRMGDFLRPRCKGVCLENASRGALSEKVSVSAARQQHDPTGLRRRCRLVAFVRVIPLRPS